jgi:hypothetical protein
LEYCSLQFADYWFATDRGLVAGLSSRDRLERLETLCRAAINFGVARTLPKAFDEGRGLQRLSPALAVLDRNTRKPIAPQGAVEVVYRVRDQLGRAYGGKAPLSVATKFLWLRNQDVFVIYDSQARAALGTRNGDYGAYLQRWQQGYLELRDAIRRVSSVLPRQRQYLSCAHSVSKQEIHEAAREEWFWKRVYDIYLWRRGSSGSDGARRNPDA